LEAFSFRFAVCHKMKPEVRGDLGAWRGLGRAWEGGKEQGSGVSPAERGLAGMCISFSLGGGRPMHQGASRD